MTPPGAAPGPAPGHLSRLPRTRPGRADAQEPTEGCEGGAKRRWRAVRGRKRNRSPTIRDRNSRPPPKWTHPPPPTLNRADTTRASPFRHVTGGAPCRVRNSIVGRTPRTPSNRPFGRLSTLPTAAPIGCLRITSPRGTGRPGGAPGLRRRPRPAPDRTVETSGGHPAEVPSRDVPDITAPRGLTTALNGYRDPRHTFRACRTTPERPPPGRKSEAGRPCGHPRTDR